MLGHGTIGFPADSQNTAGMVSSGLAGGLQQERKLGRRIAAKIADAGRASGHGGNQLLAVDEISPMGFSPKMPVLAVKAVKRAGVTENRQILKSGLRAVTIGVLGITAAGAARTNPISHTIGGQGIQIPGQLCPGGADTRYPSVSVASQTAVAGISFGNAASVHTQVAGHTGRIPRWFTRKRPFLPQPGVDTGYDGARLIGVSGYAAPTQAQAFGDGAGAVLAYLTGSHDADPQFYYMASVGDLSFQFKRIGAIMSLRSIESDCDTDSPAGSYEPCGPLTGLSRGLCFLLVHFAIRFQE
jgi:hypothetical protein